MFLYIVPLKQGLKHNTDKPKEKPKKAFLYIVPLKQGLKLLTGEIYALNLLFLYIVPLKQGLKQEIQEDNLKDNSCFYT